MRLLRLPGFGRGVRIPESPPPPPTPDDPQVVAARKKLRQSELRRRGRAASILTRDIDDDVLINRPAAATLG